MNIASKALKTFQETKKVKVNAFLNVDLIGGLFFISWKNYEMGFDW